MEQPNVSVLAPMGLQPVPLAEDFPAALMVTRILLLPLVMNAGHVVLQAAIGDKGLGAPVDQTLVWLFPAVIEFMSGELVASAEAPVAALTGERFQSGVFAKVSLQLP